MGVLIDHERLPGLITMAEAIDALEGAYRQLAAGRAVEAERSNLMLPNGWLRTMSAALLDDGIVGYKEFHRIGARSRFAYHLFEAEHGEQLALLDGRHLTALRTGACGALAVRLLTPQDASTIGVIGSGHEARSQVEAILAVRPIAEVRVFSRSPERRQRFCAELAGRHPRVRAIAVDEPGAAIDPAQILVVATNTGGRGPALAGRLLPTDRPLHVNSVGSTLPEQRELDSEAWGRAQTVVVDCEQVLTESGDALAAHADGRLEGQRIVTLAALVAGERPPIAGDAGVSLYKSVGSAIQDLAVAGRIYSNARAAGLELPELPVFQAIRTFER